MSTPEPPLCLRTVELPRSRAANEDLSSLQQASRLPFDSGPAFPMGLGGLGHPGSPLDPSGLTSAELLRAPPLPPSPEDTLQQQLAALQQQQLAQALAAEPLLGLGNLLAAQQGLSTRVQELLVLKQQLQQVVTSSPSNRGGIRGTGPLNNALYKVGSPALCHCVLGCMARPASNVFPVISVAPVCRQSCAGPGRRRAAAAMVQSAR